MEGSTLFISYAHKDKELSGPPRHEIPDVLSELRSHLAELDLKGRIKVWSDDGIKAGDKWREKIEAGLDNASIAILLISSNFLSSEFIKEKELPIIFQRKRKGLISKIIPILVSQSNWSSIADIEETQIWPSPSQPLIGLDYDRRQKEFTNIASEILELINAQDAVSETNGGSGRRNDERKNGISIVLPKPVKGELRWDDDNNYAVIELSFRHFENNQFDVEMTFNQSGNEEINRIVDPYAITLDIDKLERINNNLSLYRQTLDKILFSIPVAHKLLKDAKAQASKLGIPLRFRVKLYPRSIELHRIHWEALITSEQKSIFYLKELGFSREICGVGQLWRSVSVRRKKSRLSVALAVASPEQPVEFVGCEKRYPIDGRKELDKLQEVFVGDQFSLSRSYSTLGKQHFSGKLSAGCDVLVLVARMHKTGAREYKLELVKEDGEGQLVTDSELVEMIQRMVIVPRLLVLSPPMSESGDKEWGALAALTHFAPSLMKSGIGGLITLQRPMKSGQWFTFLSCFFGYLSKLGRTDGALAMARASLLPDEDAWSPVLWTRLRTNRFWYTPGFIGKRRAGLIWDDLIERLASKQCTPIIGPGLSGHIFRTKRAVALELAKKHHYPLGVYERVNFVQVAQYIEEDKNRTTLCRDIRTLMKDHLINNPQFGGLVTADHNNTSINELVKELGEYEIKRNPKDPHRLLAELGLPLYITANFGPFMHSALMHTVNCYPESAAFPLDRALDMKRDEKEYDLNNPLVYHLFGKMENLSGCVLTEDDYFRFLSAFPKNESLLPDQVREALNNHSLLLLGFQPNHWEFRVILRTVMSMEGATLRQIRQSDLADVAVQVHPEDDYFTSPERARNFLQETFKNKKGIDIYWGTPQDFLIELKNHMIKKGMALRKWSGS